MHCVTQALLEPFSHIIECSTHQGRPLPNTHVHALPLEKKICILCIFNFLQAPARLNGGVGKWFVLQRVFPDQRHVHPPRAAAGAQGQHHFLQQVGQQLRRCAIGQKAHLCLILPTHFGCFAASCHGNKS